MSKKEIKVIIKTNDEILENKYMALITEDKIIYREEDNTSVKFNYKNNELIRENNELNMIYHFNTAKETISNIMIKEINRTVKLPIKTTKIKKEQKSIEIEYEIDWLSSKLNSIKIDKVLYRMGFPENYKQISYIE